MPVAVLRDFKRQIVRCLRCKGFELISSIYQRNYLLIIANVIVSKTILITFQFFLFKFCTSEMKLGLNFDIKFNSFLILTLNRLGLSPLTAFVLFNRRDDVLFNATDSISFSVIRNFRLFISHSDLSISVNFLKSSKTCKSLIECILYFSFSFFKHDSGNLFYFCF